MSEELDRFTTNFSTIIQQRTRQIQDRISDFSTALEQFSNRLSGVISSMTGGVSAGTAPVHTSSGIQLVRIVNGQSQAIPVRVLDGEREERRGGGGFLSSLFGGIGSFFGGIFSGIFAPVTGVIVGAELIFALREATPLVREARGLVSDVRVFGQELVISIRRLVNLLFEQLRSAGIFPVSSLIASLLILIDTGITLIFTHISPVISWVAQLLETLTSWLGNFINSLTRWVEGVVNRLPNFFRDMILYLNESALRPALRSLIENEVRPGVHNIVCDAVRSLVESLTTVFSGLLLALGSIITESFTWAGQWIAYSIATELNKLPFVDIEVRRPEPLGQRIGQQVLRSFREAREFGPMVAQELLGPAPRAGAPSTSPGGSATGPATPPTLRSPRLPLQLLEIPEMPLSEPVLERILGAPQRRPSLPSGALPVVARTEAAERPASINVNGGVNVQITAQTIDRENAEETARLIAENVVNEIQRLTERDRFCRGLPTMSIV
jgi:hypothetical protein